MVVTCQMAVTCFFLDNRGCCGSAWRKKSRIGDFVVMVILKIKITVFTCLLSSEGCDSFPKHLDLALAPNKTNKGVKKQQNTQYHDKSWHIVT